MFIEPVWSYEKSAREQMDNCRAWISNTLKVKGVKEVEMNGEGIFIQHTPQRRDKIGFQNTLNSTLLLLNENEDAAFKSSRVQKCDPSVAQAMINLYKYDIDPTIYDKKYGFTNNDHVDDLNDAYKELSPETLYNIGTVFDNSTEDSDVINSLEVTRSQNNNNNNTVINKDDKNELENENEIKDSNKSCTEILDQVNFSASMPYLVAIFETLSNVTAQTCGGTLLSPYWVLTAASCVDVLTHLYSNTNRTELSATNASMYTIVVGSANPFFHGSAHRVTKLRLLPNVIDNNEMCNRSANGTAMENKNRLLGLAMLRIDPAASVRFLPKSQNQSEGVEDVQVFGWIVTKNETGRELMTATSFPAKTMGFEECKTYHKFSDKDSIICLIPQNNITSKVNKMNSGGPVLLEKNGELLLFGVAQLRLSVPSLVYPLANHVASIDTIIHSN